MKEWLTAREIADLQLPDLPSQESPVIRLAKREGWDAHPAFARNRAGRGGGLEYHFRVLPTLAQMEYTRRHLAITAPMPANDPAPLPTPPSERAARERDARFAIVAAFERFAAGLIRLSHTAHVQLFCDRYNAGTAQVDDWIKKLIPSISKRSLERWRSARRAGEAIGADRGLARKGTGVFDLANDGRLRDFALALIAVQPHLPAHEVRTLCRDEFGDTVTIKGRPVDMPPVRAFQRAIAALKAEKRVELTKLTNPDFYRSNMAPAGVGTYRDVTEPNTLWMIDASPVDAICVDGRHSLYACIDVATRRTVILLSRTPRASAVALLIRKAILAWGVPATIKTDNGSDFVAHDTKRLFAALGIEMELSRAYTPQQKGHVERVIKTFQHMVGPLLPGFVGHNVADRKRIEDRKSFAQRLGETEAETFGVSLTSNALQSHVDEWLELVYQHRAHAGLKGRTPFAAATASTAAVRTADPRALDLLLMPVAGKDGYRTVTKLGIRIDHFHYSAPALLPGDRVFVRQDPADLGKVYAFSADQHDFLSEAICPELAGIHPQTYVRALKEAREKLLADRTAQLRKDMRDIAKGPTLIERVLEVARRDAPNVVALPKHTQEHSTPAISAAIAAMGRHEPKRLSQEEAAVHAELEAELAAEAPTLTNVRPLRSQDTPHLRFRRALDIETRLAAGEAVEAEERGWLEGYRTGPEYRSIRELYDEFDGQISL